MASSAYLTLKGQKQGDIPGSVTLKGKENTILVHAFDNEISSTRDKGSGLLSGKQQHNPLTILKEIDKSSPRLWSALVNNETLTHWQLDFWVPQAGGVSKLTYTVQLTNAMIASIHEFMEDNDIAANVSLPLLEEVTFIYEKIQWTWVDGGITAGDDWTSVT
jgi:type VI secretion system secreted protein Hcp